MPTDTDVQYDPSLMPNASMTTNASPTAAQLAQQAAELRARAVKQAEQDVKDAEQAVRDTAEDARVAKTVLQDKRLILREVKSGPKAAKPKAEPKARKPRNGPASESVAGALSAVPDA